MRKNNTKNSSANKKKSKNKKFHSLGELFGDYQISEGKGYITQEFQDYGYRLAVELNDLKHKSLYIKLAKQENRGLLERARSFVADAQAKNKGALFMWKLKELKKEVDKEDSVSSEETEGSGEDNSLF